MSILKAAGNVLRKIFGVTLKVAEVAEPAIALAYPEISPLYDSALKGALLVEATVESGDGADKLPALTASILAQATAWATKNGVEWPQAEVSKWAAAVVDTINLIPAPKGK